MAGRKRILRKVLGLAEDLLHVPIFPRDRILAAVSSDGLKWVRRPGVAVDVKGEHGSEMVYWPHVVRFDGFRRMYFVGSHLVGGQWRERILSAVSNDGSQWRIEPGERISPDREHEGRMVFSPWVVPIRNGYRMYYTGKASDGCTCILSAVSSDGLDWRKEAGIRLAPLAGIAESVSAPAVIFEKESWRIFCTCQTGYSYRIGIACSGDGLDWEWFTKKERDLINPGPRMCAANPSPVVLDSGCRLYFSGHDGSVYGARIYFSESRDYHTWSPGVECLDYSGPFEGAEVEYCHVIKNSQGNWEMYYTGFWGRHLLAPLTSIQYRRKAKIAGAGLDSSGH